MYIIDKLTSRLFSRPGNFFDCCEQTKVGISFLSEFVQNFEII